MQWFFHEYEYINGHEYVKWQVMDYNDSTKMMHVQCHRPRRGRQVLGAFHEALNKAMHKAATEDLYDVAKDEGSEG